MYRTVLHQPLPEAMDGLVRARKPATVPTVLTRSEVRAVLAQLTGTPALVASLLYGSGLRLLECLELRVKDIDFETRQVTVRQGKGRKDRVTMLPLSAVPPLSAHLNSVRLLHHADLRSGLGRVVMPYGLAAKYPNADQSWAWQFVFPAGRICRDPHWGNPTRFHLHESVVQRAITEAVRRSGIESARVATRSGIRSRRTYWKTVTTSGPYRNCWGTM